MLQLKFKAHTSAMPSIVCYNLDLRYLDTAGTIKGLLGQYGAIRKAFK